MSNIIFDVLIEIPGGSRNKYELDENTGRMRHDRMLHTSMVYPGDYGFVPKTLSLDGDPLDVIVILTIPTIPGCIIKIKLIGVFLMSDEKGKDEKIIGVPVSDPNYNYINDINDLSIYKKNEIEHFFKVYKDLENKIVKIYGWAGYMHAKMIYEKCINRYILKNK